MSLIWSCSLCLFLWIKVASPLALLCREHLKGHNLLAPSNATMVSLGPACSPAVALAGAGNPSIALEPSLDKQESKGRLMEKVGGEHVPL